MINFLPADPNKTSMWDEMKLLGMNTDTFAIYKILEPYKTSEFKPSLKSVEFEKGSNGKDLFIFCYWINSDDTEKGLITVEIKCECFNKNLYGDKIDALLGWNALKYDRD